MADEFDTLFSGPKPQPVRAPDEFDALFSAGRTAPQELRIDDNVGKSPDEAAQLVRASKQLGEPYGLSADEPRVAIQRAKAQSAKSVIVANPFVADYVEGNPAAAQVSNDDWDKLDVFSKAWGVLTDPDGVGKLATLLGASAVNTGAKKGLAAERQGLARISGDVEGAKAFEDYVKAQPQYAGGIPYYADLVGQMVGQLGLDLGTGGVVGGAAGSVVPVVGTAFGAVGGMAAVAGNAAMGRFMMKLDEQAAAAGVTLDPTARLAATAMMGALSTGANMIGVKAGGAAVADLIAEAGVQAVAKPGVAAALGRMTANVGKGAGVGAGLMSTMAAADAVLEDAVKAASPGDLPTLFADPVRWAEVVANVATAFADGAVLMGGLHGLPAGRNFVNDLRLTREAASGKESLQALMDAREQSATWARSPESLQDFAQRHGDEKLTVTGESVAELPEGLGEKQPDGAVVIPLADYAALVEMDLHRRIADDIQHTQGGLSVNEAKLVAEYHSAAMKYASREQPPAAANDAGTVFDTWESRKFDKADESAQAFSTADLEHVLKLAKESGDSDWIAEAQENLDRASKPQSLDLPPYKTGVPTVADAFHGTNADFIQREGFSEEHLGSSTGAKSAEEATFFARNPETSNSYTADVEAEVAAPVWAASEAEQNRHRQLADTRWNLKQDIEREAADAFRAALSKAAEDKNFDAAVDTPPGPSIEEMQKANPKTTELAKVEEELWALNETIREKYGAKPNVIQARVQFQNPFVYDFKSQAYREKTYHDLIVKAKAAGHDGAIFLNTKDGGPNDVIYAVFNKEQIGHRLDNEPRRAAEGGQQRLRRGVMVDVTAANDPAGVRPKTQGDKVAASQIEEATPTPSTSMALTDPVTQAAVGEMEGMYLAPLFPEPSAVGMTAPEFTRYSKLLEARAEAIQARSVRKAARAAAEEQTPTYRAREEAVREEVERNVDERPVMVAERMARTGDPGDGSGLANFKLDREAVDAVSRPGTSDLLSGLVKRGGMHPDELAGMVGFGSGPELIQELVGVRVERDRLGLSPGQYRERMIRERTAALMEERFGNLKENIQREAEEAAIMPAATEILNAEREFLAAKAGAEMGASLADMRVAVAADFATLTSARGRNLQGFMRSVARAGREAELALLRGDYAKAFDAKQRQQLSHLYAEQAKAFARLERKAGNILRMYSENVTLDAVAQRYVDQVQGVAQQLGIPLRRDGADLAEVLAGKQGTLAAFIDGRNGELGGLIPDDPLPAKPYGEYSVQDTTQLHDLLQALDYQGRAEKKILVAGQKLDLAETVAAAAAQIKALPDRFDVGQAEVDSKQSYLRKPLTRAKADFAALKRRTDAPLLKMEQLFEWFDHHDTEGVFHQVVVKPLHQAQSLRDDMFVSIGKQLRALDQGKAWTKRLGDELPNTTLMDNFPEGPQPRRMTRKNLLAIMLNMGNPGNFEVLVKGQGWDAQAVRDFVTAHAGREDWNWVQGIWNTFKSLEPHVKATYRELAGVAPEMVTPNKVFTQFGTAAGGYFPLIKDVLRADDKTTGLSDSLFQRGQIQPMPANGYTKSRTGATYPLDLNSDLIPAYLRATAHDIAFRGAVIEANKFLSHSEVQKAVKQTFGPEYAGEFRPYLEAIANDGVQDVAGISRLNSFIAGARNATVASLIGLNPGTVAIHGMSAGFNSIGELAHQFGWKNAIRSVPQFVGVAAKEVLADGGRVLKNTSGYVARKTVPGPIRALAADAYQTTVGRITKNPKEFNAAWNEALDQSGEMRNRLHNFDRDLNMMQDRALGKRDYIAAYNNFATGFVAYGDLITAVPTYITARDLALANGKTMDEAIAIGNKTVRQAHGSAGIVDRARVQRGTEFQKVFTMFYGYFSHNYNRNRNTVREAKEIPDLMRKGQTGAAMNVGLKVMTGAVFYALLPSLNHAWIRHPRDEHDSYAKWMAGALTTQFSGDIPILRDFGNSIVTGIDPVLTPLAASAKSIVHTANNALIGAGLREGKIKHGAIAEAVNSVGVVSGAGIRQIGKAAQFLYDVKENREHPTGFYEWWRGLTSGHAKERKHH